MIQELRIGNWLLDGFGKHYQVEVADLALLASRPDTKECNPVLLTPEILEKAGFERKFTMGSTKDYWDKDGLLYAEDELVMTKGLHWLQNFHYFRTGSELPINL